MQKYKWGLCCTGQDNYSLFVCVSTNIIYLGYMRVVLFLANLTTTNILEMFRFKGFVSLRYFNKFVWIVPRKFHVEYADECPII